MSQTQEEKRQSKGEKEEKREIDPLAGVPSREDLLTTSQERLSQAGEVTAAAADIGAFIERNEGGDPFKELDPRGHVLVDSPEAVRERVKVENEDGLDGVESARYVQAKQLKVERDAQQQTAELRAQDRIDAKANKAKQREEQGLPPLPSGQTVVVPAEAVTVDPVAAGAAPPKKASSK